MGTSRSAAYRRFYLYSALSVAVIAMAIAADVLIHLGLQSLGFGSRPSSGEPSRNVSLAVAILAIAVPVGAVHLWLILRSFADPAERSTGIRHQYLNLWVAFALLIVLITIQSALSAVSVDVFADVTIQVSLAVTAAVVGAIAAWWISRTPPASDRPRIRAAVVVMLVGIGVAALAAVNAASGAGQMLTIARDITQIPRFSLRSFEEQQVRSGLLTTGFALAVWSVAYAWLRRWPESRDRLAYALLGYGVGTLALLLGVAFGIAGAIRFAGDATQVSAFTTSWPSIAAGALLVGLHGTMLVLDRGRNGHPAVTTTRLLLAFPALVGLGMIVGALGLAWHAVLERDAVTARHVTDDLTQAAALFALGTAAYVPSWLAFDRRTTAESAVRRFYLFTVVCLALVSGLGSAVTVLYQAITAAVGVGDADARRTALTWMVPTLTLALVFVTHLRLLLRDQRLTRAVDTAVATDPLVALLEDVRAGRVSTEQAAATIRGGVG